MNNELEVKISSKVQETIKQLNDLENKLSSIGNTLDKTANKVDSNNKIDSFVSQLNKARATLEQISNELGANGKLSSFINDLNRATLSAKRLDKINLDTFESQLEKIMTIVQTMASKFEIMPSNGLSKLLSSIPNSIKKLNELDMRKTYGTFNSLTRIIEPFLNKLKESEEALKSFVSISKSLEVGSKSVDKISSSYKNLNNYISKSTSLSEKFFKSFNLHQIYYYARKIFNLFDNGLDNINKYTETLNMFHLVMGDLTEQADSFQTAMSNAFGNNTQQQLEYQSYFQTLTESMGLQEKYAYIISENMTKMTYDISSLFDEEQEDVASALRAGLVGQTKPVRNFGMDITENSLQPILDKLGIDRTVRELSQAEKEIVRYLALLQQSSIAHGDMANTIESPANQLRVLKNQLVECQRWFSALFINTFAKALPYMNAVVMATKEICIWLGNLFGIEISDYNSGIATYEDELDYLGETTDDTTGKVKELKRQLLGFDQINNINEDTDSDSTVSGGIDQRLLDAITGYDNGMDKVRMKAMEIRDSIMEWLGFTYDEVNKVWKLTKKFEFLKNIWKWFKNLNTEGKIFVGLGIAVTVGKIINTVEKLSNILGISGLFGKLKDLKDIFGNLVYAISSNGLSSGLDLWSGTLTNVEKLKTSLIGAGGLVIGWSLMNDALKEFNETGEYSTNVVLRGLGSALSNVASGAILGATYGGAYGAVIGSIAGAVITLVEALSGLETEEQKQQKLFDEKNEKLKEASQNYLDYNKAIDDNTNSLLSAQSINEDYVKELQNIVDENGNIKKGYEERANFILGQLSSAYGIEYTIVDGQIQKYNELIETINKTIEKKKIEILLNANQDKYAKAIKEKTTNWKNYQEAVDLAKKAEEEYNKKIKEIYDANNVKKTFEEFKKELEESGTLVGSVIYENYQKSQKTLKETENVWNETIDAIITYENLWSANTSNNLDEIIKALETYSSENSLTLSEQISLWKNYGDRIAETTGEVNDSTYSMLETTISTLKSQSQTIDDLSDDVIEAWGTLASESEEKFLENFEKLPSDVQTEIVDKMNEKGYAISDELQKGMNRINPTIKIKTDTSQADTKIKIEADTSSAESTLKKLIENFKKGFGAFGISIGGGFRANGGVFSQGNWKAITQYASGGLPSTGELFIAREAGAELVGKIGNSTAVMNNMQIVDSVKAGVYEAVRDAMNVTGGKSQAIKVYASKDVIVETAIEGINNIKKQTGESPIDVW